MFCLFSVPLKIQEKNDLAFIEKGLAQGHRPELVGGGLIRSLAGWSEVLASRRRDEKQSFDQRILGDGDFVNQMVSGLDNFVKNLRLSGQRMDMEAVAEKVAEKYEISIEELVSGSQRRQVAEARRALSRICVQELGYSGADVARFLVVAYSCVTRIISNRKMDTIDDFDLSK